MDYDIYVCQSMNSRWLAICFCHQYFNAKIVVLSVTELSFKLVSLADWQASSMSRVTLGSVSLILDDSNTEMFLQAKISLCCAFAIKPTSSNNSILCIKPFLMLSNLCAIHSFISTVHVWEMSGRVTAPSSKDCWTLGQWIICLDLNAEQSNSKHNSEPPCLILLVSTSWMSSPHSHTMLHAKGM